MHDPRRTDDDGAARMRDLATITVEDFAATVGSGYAVRGVTDDPLELELVAADARRDAPEGAPRAPFSLLFLGPPAPALSQGTFPLRHADLGELEIFLVPVGVSPDGGRRYEAVFA